METLHGSLGAHSRRLQEGFECQAHALVIEIASTVLRALEASQGRHDGRAHYA